MIVIRSQHYMCYCCCYLFVCFLLQPENVVLKDRSSRMIKIIDFGTSQDLSVNPPPSVMVGTPEFIGKNIDISTLLSCS